MLTKEASHFTDASQAQNNTAGEITKNLLEVLQLSYVNPF
jgi:hypothetical protein